MANEQGGSGGRGAKVMPAYIEVTIRYNTMVGEVDKITGPMDNAAMMYGIISLGLEAYDLHRQRTIKREAVAIAQGPGLVRPDA